MEEDSESEAQSDAGEESESEKPTARPYMALLQSFQQDPEPKAKRRKMHHDESQQKAPAQKQDDGASSESDDEKDVDHVDEPEETAQDAEIEEQIDSDDEEDEADPFESHFAHPDEKLVATHVAAVKKAGWTTKKALVPAGRATAMLPSSTSKSELPAPITTLDGLHLKQKLKESAKDKLPFNEFQQNLSPLLFNYNDLLYCDRTVKNSTQLRQLTCLHAVNHVLKTRDRIIKDNYRLAKEGEDTDLELRDQGFTRPKVLFLLPTRHACLRMVNTIRDITQPDQEENRKRFDESYHDKEQTFGTDRPVDFRHLFEGNDDDMFRIGVKFTRKTIKYFSQFYNSDILFASPLGLRMAIGSVEEKDKKKGMDYDFLSSIEMVVMDQADALLMQNWEHVEFIFEHMNRQPKDAHDCDFSRVRNWYLEDWAKYFRQTVILSAFNTPELSELFRSHCHNWAGKIRVQQECPGSLQQLGVRAKQTFSRFQPGTVDREPDARFEYFNSAIVPSLVKRAKDATGTLIFVPSYLDFVRVRNFFATSSSVESLTFGAISEYTDIREASRARSHFLNGRHKILLYTERAHHFRRYQIRGVRRIIFYGLPDNPIFYKEIAGGCLLKSEEDMELEPGQGTVRSVFSKYDVMKLERIVGSKRVGKMLQERGDTFDFV
jgi:U3 small nucleolar RNA-associated protein 25